MGNILTHMRLGTSGRWLAVLVTSLLLASCIHTNSHHGLSSLPLLTPKSLGKSWQVSQSIQLRPLREGDNTDKTLTFIAAWSVNHTHISLVGLTPTGQTLLSLRYNGEQLEETYSPLLAKRVAGREVLTQLQLAHWPVEVINQHLLSGPWRLEEHGTRRDLYQSDSKILSIVHHPSVQGTPAVEHITITNSKAGYLLNIHTLTQDNLL